MWNKAYPNTPTIRLRRVLVRDGLWVVEAVNVYTAAVRYPTW
jgi:hypothetical protein